MCTMHPVSKLFSQGFKIFKPEEIKTMRHKLGESRCEFADRFFASVETIKSWEIGRRQPSCSSIRLLQIVEHLAEEKHGDINHRIRMAYK